MGIKLFESTLKTRSCIESINKTNMLYNELLTTHTLSGAWCGLSLSLVMGMVIHGGLGLWRVGVINHHLSEGVCEGV